eukprot:38721-Rhodomonas_salina.2
MVKTRSSGSGCLCSCHGVDDHLLQLEGIHLRYLEIVVCAARAVGGFALDPRSKLMGSTICCDPPSSSSLHCASSPCLSGAGAGERRGSI